MEQITIKKLIPYELQDFKDLISLFEQVFEVENFIIPSDEHLNKLLAKDNFDVFVAIRNKGIVGGLTSYTLDQYYSVKPLAYIYDLAVDTKYQRKGTGRKLIEFVRDYYTKMGYEEVFVQADRVDQHALDFYRSTKPTEEEDVLHYYYTL